MSDATPNPSMRDRDVDQEPPVTSTLGDSVKDGTTNLSEPSSSSEGNRALAEEALA